MLGDSIITKSPQQDNKISMLSAIQEKLTSRLWYKPIVLTAMLTLMVIVASIDFWLSFSTLTELGSYGKWDVNQSRGFAVSIDSVLLAATLGIFASEMYSWRKRAKVYMWVMLSLSSVLTLVGNGLTPYLTAQLFELNTIVNIAIHIIPPLLYIMLVEGLRVVLSEIFTVDTKIVKQEKREAKKLTAKLTPQEKRQQYIINLIQQGKELVYVDLAKQLNTSRQTISKDVSTLEDEGVIFKNGDGYKLTGGVQ